MAVWQRMSKEELDEQTRFMIRWRLIRKRYQIVNGRGDWYYKVTLLGELVFHWLHLVAKLKRLEG